MVDIDIVCSYFGYGINSSLLNDLNNFNPSYQYNGYELIKPPSVHFFDPKLLKNRVLLKKFSN